MERDKPQQNDNAGRNDGEVNFVSVRPIVTRRQWGGPAHDKVGAERRDNDAMLPST